MNSSNEDFVKISFQISLTETQKQRLLMAGKKKVLKGKSWFILENTRKKQTSLFNIQIIYTAFNNMELT